MSEIQKVLYTAGAVPVRNEKGELRMEKVKVTRYISGKRPAYAQSSSENESSSGEEENETKYDVRQVVSYNDVIQRYLSGM
jgi:microfibrillar-associated protein 1